MTTTRTSNAKAGDLIADRVGFTGNNLYGVVTPFDSDDYTYGRIPQEFGHQLKLDRPDYIVYSYGTPIAWHSNSGWFMPNCKYSVTTSKHQNYVRRAVA
jgi:restriction endonuclease S subunit